jgi:Flp pilus assembly protein TadD
MLLVQLGTVQLMANQRLEARKAFEAALGSNPDIARAHSSLGAMAAEEGRRDEALSHWRTAVALDPGEYEKLLAIGLSLARSGRPAEARAYVQLFVGEAPPARYAADIARAKQWLNGTFERTPQTP